jgi:hypothetical protein
MSSLYHTVKKSVNPYKKALCDLVKSSTIKIQHYIEEYHMIRNILIAIVFAVAAVVGLGGAKASAAPCPSDLPLCNGGVVHCVEYVKPHTCVLYSV